MAPGKSKPSTKNALPEPAQLKAALDRLLRAFTHERRLLYLLGLFAFLTAILLLRSQEGIRVHAGEIAERDYISPRTLTFVDEEKTRDLKRQAAEEVGQVYRILPTYMDDIDSMFKKLTDLREGRRGANPDDVRDKMMEEGIDDATASAILSMSPEDVDLLRAAVTAAVRRAGPKGLVQEKELLRLDLTAEEVARDTNLHEQLIPALRELLNGLKGNLAVDQKETQHYQNVSMANVRSARRTIREKQSIVRSGELIRGGDVDLMKRLGMLRAPISPARVIGSLFLTALFLFAVASYAKSYSAPLYRDQKRVAIYFILIGFGSLGAVALTPISGNLMGLCIGVPTILSCVLLESNLALMTAPLLALYLGLTLDMQTQHIFVGIAGGFAAHYFAVRRHDRDNMLKAGIAVGLTSMMVSLAFTAIQFESWGQTALNVLLYSAINGLGAFVIAYGLIPVFEKVYNVTTPRRLLELSNPEEPLLKQLLIQAPGTYHHCIFVGNLAESAAELLGADTLLVRSASYYHDVGKLKRPYFFTENRMHAQSGSQLSDVSPTLGALVIASHVKDGVELAREHNLPPEIIRMIQEHHGSCLISFFYQQARAAAREGDEVSKERFRYPGPKPQTLESAILMMADSCEAAIRSLKEPTGKTIENLVNSIFEARIIDKQFDQCHITLKQLDEMRYCFIKALAGVYHSRIEYPDLKEMETVRE